MVKQALQYLQWEAIAINGSKFPLSHSMRELVENLTNTFDAGSATISKPKRKKSDKNMVSHLHISKRESDQVLMHQSSFDIATIDNFTGHLLSVSCRTGDGGDIFFTISLRRSLIFKIEQNCGGSIHLIIVQVMLRLFYLSCYVKCVLIFYFLYLILLQFELKRFF